ncbi:MAG: type VI secretion system contractile sheath large subunit [Deltaproteobacteria bacterium]|nr:type VI secretion system contractile sheath large subunit [Deltaproteobacteria bacterium]MBW2534650.1 type VI secretion system contractile sheath large subunit [Deltaproteobacteria bacterium]
MGATGDEYALLFRASLEGSVLVRIEADEQVSEELEDDWPAPRPFLYALSVRIVTERHRWALNGDETYGDLQLRLERGPQADSESELPDWLERRVLDGTGRRVHRVTFSRPADCELLDGLALELDDGSEYVLFTGELADHDDEDGNPQLRHGDEMLLLFSSRAAASKTGLRFEPTALRGRIPDTMRRWLDETPDEPSAPPATATAGEPTDWGDRQAEQRWPWFELRAPVFDEVSTTHPGCSLLYVDGFEREPQSKRIEDRRLRQVQAADQGAGAIPGVGPGGAWFAQQRERAAAPTSVAELVKLQLLAATHLEVTQELEDAPETTKSDLYQTIYSAEYGTSRGVPYAAIGYGHPLGCDDAPLLRDLVDVALRAQALLAVTLGPTLWGVQEASQIEPKVARLGVAALPASFQEIFADADHVIPCAPVEAGVVAPPVLVLDSVARSFETTGLCYPLSDATAAQSLSRAFADAGICTVEASGHEVRLVGVPVGARVRAVAMQLLRAVMLACRSAVFRHTPAEMERHVQAWLDELALGAERLLRSGRCRVELRELPVRQQMWSWVAIDLDLEILRWPGHPVAVRGLIDTE